jgi:hypothetical protein
MLSYLFNTLRYRKLNIHTFDRRLLRVVVCTSLILKMIYYIFATLRENSVLSKAKHLYFWSWLFVLHICLILLFKLNVLYFSMKDEFFFLKILDFLVVYVLLKRELWIIKMRKYYTYGHLRMIYALTRTKSDVAKKCGRPANIPLTISLII